MTAYDHAIAELKALLKSQKPEPYTGRARRPNNYRNAPEYKTWSAHRQEWAEQIRQWEATGLAIVESETRVEVTLYGRTVPETAFIRAPDGCIKLPPPERGQEDDPFPQWIPAIPVPRPKEKAEKFLERQTPLGWPWNLSDHLDRMMTRERIDLYREFAGNNKNDLHHNTYARERNYHCRDFTEQWLEAVKRLLDPRAISRLNRLAGQKVDYNLRNHNLAIASAEAVKAVAASNPGALAWWTRLADRPENAAGHNFRAPELPPHIWPFMTTEPETRRRGAATPIFPSHPGQIIAGARADYQAAGGARWKAMASQPAEHIAQQLDRHGPEAAAWLSEALSAAALPLPAPRPEPAPPVPRATVVQETMTGRMFGDPPAETARPRPGRPKAPAAIPLQPPLEIKLMLLEIHRRNRRDTSTDSRKRSLLNFGGAARNPAEEGHRRTAIRQAAILAGRHYAGAPRTEPNTRGRQRLTMEFEDLADYIFADPAAAARATTWKGLRKASARWHQANNLRTMQEHLLEEARLKSEALSGWQTPITEVDLEPGVTATVLTSAQELVQEAVNLDHCVGGIGYASQCADGKTRIIHIHPAPEVHDPEAPDHRGTTLEIYLNGRHWSQGQHRGRFNRPPTDAEARWGKRFMQLWQKAMKDRADRILKELSENEDQEQDEE